MARLSLPVSVVLFLPRGLSRQAVFSELLLFYLLVVQPVWCPNEMYTVPFSLSFHRLSAACWSRFARGSERPTSCVYPKTDFPLSSFQRPQRSYLEAGHHLWCPPGRSYRRGHRLGLRDQQGLHHRDPVMVFVPRRRQLDHGPDHLLRYRVSRRVCSRLPRYLLSGKSC